MNLVEICKVKYPGQIEAGNISFRQPDDNTFHIVDWNVEGIPRPNEAELMAEEPQWADKYIAMEAFNVFLAYIDSLLNKTARDKQYGSAVSIATYTTSTEPQWKAEADVFVAWRDAVFVYAINIQTQVQAGQMPIPSFDEFVAGIPAIVWPS